MKTKFLALAFAALMPFAASADVSYSFFEVNYQFSGTFEVVGCCEFDTDGFGVKGSFAVNDNWYVQFDYNDIGTDPDIGSTSNYALSAGWHNEMFFARLGYESAEEPLGTSGSGYVFDLGLRSMVSDSFELNAHVGMSDLGDFGSTMNYGVGAMFLFGDNMGVTFNYDLRSVDDFAAVPALEADYDTMGLGIRFTFD
jgi:hypothetical protein